MSEGSRSVDVRAIIAGAWTFEILAAAVDVGLFTAVAEQEGGAASVERLAATLGLDQPTLEDVVSVLVDLGLLVATEAGLTCGDQARTLLVDSSPEYLGDYVAFCHRSFNPSWRHLASVLRHGTPRTAEVESPYDRLYRDEDLAAAFLGGMESATGQLVEHLVRVVDWDRHERVVDVGGATGDVLWGITRRHPHVEAVVFDLPAVEPHFQRRADGSTDVGFVAGDVFKDPLPPADAMVVGHVLHNWDAAASRQILDAVGAALTPGGTVYVYDQMITGSGTRRRPLSSLGMRVWTAGGAEYSVEQCLGWLQEAGFVDLAWHEVDPTGDVLVSATKPR
ncbi:MAG: methyltransferase [Aeromicrobium erythreum]